MHNIPLLSFQCPVISHDDLHFISDNSSLYLLSLISVWPKRCKLYCFSKNQLLALLIFSIAFFIPVSLISALLLSPSAFFRFILVFFVSYAGNLFILDLSSFIIYEFRL